MDLNARRLLFATPGKDAKTFEKFSEDLDKQQGLIAKWNLQTLPAFMVNDTLSVMAANEWILAQAIQNASVEAG